MIKFSRMSAHAVTGTMTMALAVLAAGCVGDKGVAPALRSADITLGTASVSPMNAIMAVGETLPVVVQGRSLSGATITQFDSVQYRLENATDTLRVRVSSSGTVTALAPSSTNSPVLLTAIAFKDGVAAADQVTIQVVTAAFANPTLSIQPVPPDNAIIAWGDSKNLRPIIQNDAGASVFAPTLRLEYGPGDSVIMQCYVPPIAQTATLTQTQLRRSACGQNGNAGSVTLNQIHAFRKGAAWVHARVTVFGVPLHDSVQFTVTNPNSAEIDIGTSSTFSSGEEDRLNAYIAPGGLVYFVNAFNPALGASVSFTLDNPDAALPGNPPASHGGSSGNITSITRDEFYSYRIFVTPGVYHWTAHVTGGIPPYTGATVTGTITVE